MQTTIRVSDDLRDKLQIMRIKHKLKTNEELIKGFLKLIDKFKLQEELKEILSKDI